MGIKEGEMAQFLKKIVYKTCSLGVLGTILLLPIGQVQAASPWQVLLGGAVSMAVVSDEISKLDDTPQGQASSLKKTKEKTGYLANEAYQWRAKKILQVLEKTPTVKRKYEVYVNPDEDFNAFMTIGRVMSINKGAMDLLDDGELAYVMAHELGHGEHKDIVHGIKKQVGLSTALGVATANSGAVGVLVGNVSANYIENQVFTMGQEKAADELGFKILSETPYNLGSAAAAMAVIKEKHGDLYREGLNQVLNPNNHPKTTNRITDNLKRLYEYSGKKVKVEGKTVYINGKAVYEGVAAGRYTASIRAYLVAGKLARIFHDRKEKAATQSGSTVYMNDVALVTAESYDDAQRIVKSINQALK